MKKYRIITLLLLVLSISAKSQTDSTSFLNKTEFKAGYYGNFVWDNGLNVGGEYLWIEKKKIKEKRRGQKTIVKQRLFNANLGFSTNFANKTDNGLTTHLGFIWRRTNPKGWQLNFELNALGYYRAFLPETFEVNEGEVSKVKLPGRSYYAPSFEFGMGRFRKDKPITGWYLNFNCTFRTPYNAGTLPTFSLKYGCRFKFKKK